MTWGPAVSSLKQAQPGTSALKTAGLCAVGPGGLEIGLNLLMGQRTPESSEQLVLGEPYNFRSEKQVSFLLLVPKSPHPIYLCVCVRACACLYLMVVCRTHLFMLFFTKRSFSGLLPCLETC